MNVPSALQVGRKVSGYALFELFHHIDGKWISKGYWVQGPNGAASGCLELGAAMKIFRRLANAQFELLYGYQWCEYFKDGHSDEIVRYEIVDPDGQVMFTSESVAGLEEARAEFERIANDALEAESPADTVDVPK